MSKKVEIIQLLRGLAALLICFFHMKGMLVVNGVEIGDVLFRKGSVGVPFFFMISGFIMVMTTQNSEPSLKYIGSFYLKRAIRIIPIYYLLTFVLIFSINFQEVYFTRLSGRLLSGLLFIPTGVNHVGPSYGMPPLEVGWSLNYEVFFYLLLGLSLFAGRFKWLALSIVIFILVVVFPLLSKGYILTSLSGWYGYKYAYVSLITNPVIIFFLTGVFIGALYVSEPFVKDISILNGLVYLSLFVFAFSMVCNISVKISYLYDLTVISFLFFALMMRNRIKPYSIWKPFVVLGNISYSFYLVHAMVILLAPRILSKFGLRYLMHEPWFFFVLVPVIIALSWLSWFLLEQKMCGWIASKLFVKTNKVHFLSKMVR